MPIVEIFISAFVTVLFEKLASGELLAFARRQGIHTEIKKWSDMLRKIKHMLSYAEDQQITNQNAQIWLEELQDLAYDLDDVLDEFATEQLKQKLDGLIPFQPNTIKSKVKALLPGCCTSSGSFSPRAFMFGSSMRSKIDEISTRLESITTQMRDLNLDNISKTSANKPATHRTPTTSLINEPKICGRDKEIKEITEFILRVDESGKDNNEIGVIPIVGMGGIGKTTLARAVYNDENVKKHFPLRAWVCVSDEFDVVRITKTVLESVTSKKCDFNDLDKIQVELKKSLAGRKFLIVLDDVWQKEYDDWCVLKSPFSDAASGSKVIVTTRDKKVASLMESSKRQHHILQSLSFDDCWSVFAQHAFGNSNMNENAKLVEIGKKIVERCKGLPLSAKVLGGILRGEENEAEWKDVLDSEVWLRKDNQILPSLRLSYHHLPSYLKPCFAYCSIFPKDYRFGKEQLVLLWMAEGLVQQEKGKRQLEDIGRDYFHDLMSRSLFQSSGIEGDEESFVMHDLINDLAQEISGHLCFRLEDEQENQEKSRNLGRARYSSFLQGRYGGMKKFENFSEGKHLRTFLPFALEDERCCLAYNVPSNLFPKLRRLRSLSLRYYNVTDLPDSVGDMKHLRYLDLSFTDIETLPDWVQKLYNLQTLILRECRELKNLPKNMGNLTNLRYFDVTNADSLKEMPLGIGNMKNLCMLSNFIVTKDNGLRIRELGKLRHIGKTLCISGLHNVTDPMDAKEACIIEKEHLSKLIMLYGATSDELPNEETERKVLHMLQPHNNLKELHIREYHGIRFPTWLENPVFTNMVHIEMTDCRKCSVLPPLGQLKSLKKLYIRGMNAVKHVGREFYGQLSPKPFPNLEILSFEDMPEWEDWFAFGVDDGVQPFAFVYDLRIINCPKLVGKLPTDLPSLKVLEIIECQKLVVELDSLVYPSLTSLEVDDVELTSNPSMPNNVNNTHESIPLSPLSNEIVSIPGSLCNMSTSFQHLNSMKISNVSKVVYLTNWLTRDLKSLEWLSVYNCKGLQTLVDKSKSDVMQLQLPVLQHLEISLCPELVSLFSEEEEGESGGMQRESETVQSFMKSLQSLRICDCKKLEKLPRGMYMLTCLVELDVNNCPNLVFLPGTGFPPTLRILSISFCNALKSPLPCWNSDHNLEILQVWYCGSLTALISSSCSSSNNNSSIRTGGLPSSLKCLWVGHCEKLEVLIAGEEENKIHCPSLEYISFSGCGRLKYLPDTRADDSLGKLKELNLSRCGALPQLPDGWFRVITNLSRIYIGNWRKGGQMSVFSYILKEAGFLTNLTVLRIEDITTALHPAQWGLHRISSLRELTIRGPIRIAREKEEEEEEEEEEVVDVSVFPLDGMLLPTTLTRLWIRDFPDLERLSSKGFESLGSLQELGLFNLPKLAHFPEGGLPDTLQQLQILRCPLLYKKCEKGKGQYWPIISRIPYCNRPNVEKDSLLVTSPEKIKGTHDSAIGNLWRHGGSMAETVIYPKDNRNGCKSFDESGISFKSRPGSSPTFVLIDRRDCFFVLKVWNSRRGRFVE